MATDLQLVALQHDWFGAAIDPPVCFGFGLDPERFHFIAKRDQGAKSHPAARPGEFQAELWKYDVAEFFLSNPATGRYLEFNLSPNGAWWSCEFDAPRQRRFEEERPIPGVMIEASQGDGSWLASAALPRSWLEEHFDFGPASRLNATFILDSPSQRFVTASSLGPGEPDYHRPEAFPAVVIS